MSNFADLSLEYNTTQWQRAKMLGSECRSDSFNKKPGIKSFRGSNPINIVAF
jgi:hypothetical protein